MKKYSIKVKECEESKTLSQAVIDSMEKHEIKVSNVGKLLFLKCNDALSTDTYAKLQQTFNECLKDYFEKVVILEEGIDLCVLELIEEEK